MADCNACPDYLSPEDLIRRSVLCSDGKVAALATLLNPLPEVPDGALQFEDSTDYLQFEDSEEYLLFETI